MAKQVGAYPCFRVAIFVGHRRRVRSLPGVVRVMEAGHALDLVALPAEEIGEAAEEVDAGDHAAGLHAEAVGELRHAGGVTLAPEPDLGRLVDAAAAPFLID